MPVQRLLELFDVAQDISAAQRAAWLDEAGGEGHALRRALERLLSF